MKSKMKNRMIGAIVGDIAGRGLSGIIARASVLRFSKKRVNRGILAFLPTTV